MNLGATTDYNKTQPTTMLDKKDLSLIQQAALKVPPKKEKSETLVMGISVVSGLLTIITLFLALKDRNKHK